MTDLNAKSRFPYAKKAIDRVLDKLIEQFPMPVKFGIEEALEVLDLKKETDLQIDGEYFISADEKNNTIRTTPFGDNPLSYVEGICKWLIIEDYAYAYNGGIVLTQKGVKYCGGQVVNGA